MFPVDGGVSNGDGNGVGFVLPVHGVACCRYIKLDFVRGIGKIGNSDSWGVKELQDFANVFELAQQGGFLKLEFFYELAVTSVPEYPVDSTKTSVWDRVENGGECRGVGVLSLLR